jgi:hypothetical protein
MRQELIPLLENFAPLILVTFLFLLALWRLQLQLSFYYFLRYYYTFRKTQSPFKEFKIISVIFYKDLGKEKSLPFYWKAFEYIYLAYNNQHLPIIGVS